MSDKAKKLLVLGLVYLFILIGGLAVGILLVEEITKRSVLSLVFILIPYTVFFGITAFNICDTCQNTMQNGLTAIMAIIYFIVAFAVTVITNLLCVPMKWFAALEIITLIFGVIIILISFAAKSHIESK